MKKIRINELARELEVKPQRILELLPELGVADKKTHSSSLDDDVADLVRRHFGVDGAGSNEPREPAEFHDAAGGEFAAPEVEEYPAEEKRPAVSTAEVEERVSGGGTAVAEPEEEAALESAPGAASEAGRSRPAPIRPPLQGRSGAGPAPTPGTPTIRPSAPFQPPAPRPSPAAPAARPAAPARPAPSTARPPAPAAPPTPRPGQILSTPRPTAPSGPRQPLPGSVLGPPGTAVPGTPRPAAPAPPRPSASPARPAAAEPSSGSSAPPQQRPVANRPLAGQPVARPVVPPRPDMVARLQQQQPRTAPGQPAPIPRPGMPSRPSGPVPGQPIYRGPLRPGQPLMRGPGAPGTGAPGARITRGRPMHPTTMRIEPAAPVPTEQQRRHQVRPGGARPDRRHEEEEKNLRMPSRREQAAPPPINREITVSEGVTVKELSEKLGVKANLVIKKLFDKKIFATINQTLDVKMAEELAREFGASTNKVSYEQESTQEIEAAEVSQDLQKRPPVVTVMGHVDHGKTSLLDAIRSSNVADREAGGITQHIGAYSVEKNGRRIVFIDTPGHEAFTQMRARGAKVTDIVILVVAADDGVMPQTLEAINHAKAANVPIVVAITKIDKPDAQSPDRIKQQLSDRGLLAEDWGGDTVMVPVSARKKQGLEELLEMLVLVADMQDLKANPERPAVGTVLEAELDRGRGPVATVIVRNGTLKVGDYFICGAVFGKVRAMYDDRGNQVREAEPSMPVEVLGLESLPEVGDTFQVVTDTGKAKQIVIYREARNREQTISRGTRVTLESLHEQLKEGEIKDLNIIIKADVGGTAEVLSDVLQKLSNDKVRIRVIHSGVGAINEWDVMLGSASDAIIIGFNVRPERKATAVAEQEKVDIRLHTIIYELTDEIKRAMTGMLEPVYKEVYQGRAEIREVFRISKVGNVAGCMVLDGLLRRDSQVRILRDNIVIFTGKVESLRRFKNDASEVKSGFECGITIHNFSDVKPGDIIEGFVTERVAPEVMV